ncbi:MAG TPA: response regulator [Thermoguttaceae bacterium]|nr:response regulator [Thermoguttaceae bacterium]
MTKRLLVVDDALIIREIIKDAVTNSGWEIAGEAANGQEAVEQYQALQPDAVTLDLVMPEYDGLHALRGILDVDPSAKVVVVSALDQKDILKQAFRLGATDFVVKPFNNDALVQTLETVFANGTATSAT